MRAEREREQTDHSSIEIFYFIYFARIHYNGIFASDETILTKKSRFFAAHSFFIALSTKYIFRSVFKFYVNFFSFTENRLSSLKPHKSKTDSSHRFIGFV